MQTCIFCDEHGSAAREESLTMDLNEQVTQFHQQIKNRYKAEFFLAYFQAYTSTFLKLQKMQDAIDFVLTKDFIKISSLENDVILISGNSDFTISDNEVSRMPSNVKAWFATNAIVEHPKIIPIPLGIENYKDAERPEHGVGYDRALEKENFILNYVDRTPKNLIYAIFRWGTNPTHRNSIINNILI
jgi:hypothetical protein